MLKRKAEKAGSWYTANRLELEREIDEYTSDSSSDIPGKVIAAVVPHAGYVFSGAIAGLSFSALRKSRAQNLKTIIILGAVHTMPLDLPAVWPDGVWESPVGDVEVDAHLAQKITETTCAVDLPQPHFGDNAIELQIPFVAQCFDNVKIVPIAVAPSANAVNFGRELYDCCKNRLDEIAVVASSDLTHYGAAYGFAPAGGGVAGHEWGKENDRKLLKMLCELESAKIIPETKLNHNACGAGALAATAEFARLAGCKEGKVLSHRTSLEVMPRDDGDMFVGYASVIFTV